MQVEALFTRSLSSPVYTFPFWEKVEGVFPVAVQYFVWEFDIFFLKGIMCIANCLFWDIVECP